MNKFKPGDTIVATQDTETYGGVQIAVNTELVVMESLRTPGSAYNPHNPPYTLLIRYEGYDALVDPDHFMRAVTSGDSSPSTAFHKGQEVQVARDTTSAYGVNIPAGHYGKIMYGPVIDASHYGVRFPVTGNPVLQIPTEDLIAVDATPAQRDQV